ncbi:SusC/RagA family TonB-linked outer membrane protein [Solitalea koreensis]|uniref:TonB-linked outer membrane protein, SusC/RagA family n=1 Tax=Solitalea koreensis TaxID=543615 RepID=A0A521AVD9_9SPHI|nr:SusC/RagA family TonB-linked outer membrane protein [Solitalea koreensis]SMO38808.1 TonB-linked outer membrane protein, SusC/RagA family [Solitalea koreensis]
MKLKLLFRKSSRLIPIKLTSMLIIVATLLLSANAYSESITLHGKNVSLESALESVSKQSGYKVFYKQEQLAKANPVSVSFRNLDLTEALEQLFINQPFAYAIANKTIVITEKTGPAKLPSSVKRRTISGVITDQSNKVLHGATVMEKGTNNVTTTDAKGAFTLTVEEKAQIQISFLGYEPRTITVGDQSVINVALKIAESSLKEVVVTTGIFKKVDESFTGASRTVTAKELEQFSNRNLITSLRNVDPSFNIVESNSFGSDPNRLPEIQIRGNSSLPNVNDLQNESRVALNTPLVILDGFQSTLQKLLDINANEVESLTILKDASATAIYGSRGANGVVVITTKAPKEGKLRVSYRGDVNVEAPDLSAYNLLNAREKLDLEKTKGLYNGDRPNFDIPLKRYYSFLLTDVNSGVDTYWLSKPLNTGVGQRHNLRLEGGDQTFRYSASMQLNDIQGVMIGSNRKTYNGTINLAYTFKNVKFSNSLMIAKGSSANSPYGNFSDYVKLNPYWKAYDENGKAIKILGDSGNDDYRGRWSTLPTNPLYNATLNTFDKSQTSEITNNTSVEFPIIQDLIMRGRIGITQGDTKSDKFRPADHTAFANYGDADIFRKGDYNYGVGSRLFYDASVNLSYSKTLGDKHTLFGGLDYNISQGQSSDYSFLAEGFTNPNFDFITMAQQYAKDGRPTGAEGLTRAIGITGNANYIYDNRYFVDGSFRVDGSSQFGANKRFAPFWSAGAGWNMHKEAFLNDSKVINRLKLRGSLGLTGSQNFSSYQALSSYRYYTDDRYINSNGAYLMGLGNKDLKWQQTMKYNVGMDAELLDRRLKLTADYYIQNTNGLVSSVNLPGSSGFASYIENIGKLNNKGYELKATAFLIRNADRQFIWSVTMGVMHNKNKIVQISQALKDAQAVIEKSTGATPSTLFKEGYSSNTIWVVPSLGIDPSTGKELYLAKDGQHTFVWNPDNLTAAGSTDPKIQGNLSTMVRYKDLSLNVVLGYRTGGQLYNQTLINKVENADYNYNVDARVYNDRWRTPGDNVQFKSLMITDLTNKTSRFVQDENTINCQNINLQYNMGFLSKRLGVEALSISASMADAFYFSTVKQERGIQYPFSRQFSLSINTTF